MATSGTHGRTIGSPKTSSTRDSGGVTSPADANWQNGTQQPERRIKEDSELYTVDKTTDTVRGQLDNYTDFGSPLMKRISAQGQTVANRRGLTNSSIAAQGAMGNVLDKAGEWATRDAGFYNERKTETLRSKTALESSDIGAAASRYGAYQSAEAQRYSAKTAANAAKSVANINNSGAMARLQESNTFQGEQNQMQRDADWKDTVAKGMFDLEGRKLDNQGRIDAVSVEQSAMTARHERELQASGWSDTQNQMGNLNQKASPASQDAYVQRILDLHALRQEAMYGVDEELDNVTI